MLKAFKDKKFQDQKLMLILAGNSCKSSYVRSFIDDFMPTPETFSNQDWSDYNQRLHQMFGNDQAFINELWPYLSIIKVKRELLDGIHDDQFNTKINGKTVLATGLLELCPTEGTLFIEEENDINATSSLYALGIWDDDDDFDIRIPLLAKIDQTVVKHIYMGTANGGYFTLVYSNIDGKHSRSQIKQKVWQSRIQLTTPQHKHVWMIPLNNHSFVMISLDRKNDIPDDDFHKVAYQYNLPVKLITFIELEIKCEDQLYMNLFPNNSKT
jgi:hypothetical protein